MDKGGCYIAPNSNYIVQGSLENDVIICTGASNQRILMGSSNVQLCITSNAVGVNLSNPQAQLHASNITTNRNIEFSGFEVITANRSLGYSNASSNIIISIPNNSDTISFRASTNTIAQLGSNFLTSTYLSSLNMGSFKNKIINGDMSVSQRATTSNFVNVSGFAIDRWQTGISTGTGTITAAQNALTSSDAPFVQGFRYSLKCTATSVTAYTDAPTIAQSIENFIVQDLDWGLSSGIPVTISFWFKASISGSYSVSINNNYNNNAWASYPILFTYNTGDTWQFVTITVPAPPISNNWSMLSTPTTSVTGLLLFIGANSFYTATSGQWGTTFAQMATGSTIWMTTNNNYIEVTGVQLEKGTIATPFEFMPFHTELRLCQRFFEIIVPSSVNSGFNMGYYGSSGQANNLQFRYKVAKRAIPTLPTVTANTGTLASYISTLAAYYNITSSSSFSFTLTLPFTATAELSWQMPGWTPSAVSNLKNWYVAASTNMVFSSGTTIQQWTDLSGTNNHATQPTSASRPVLNATGLNNLPMVDFNNVSGVRLNVPSADTPTFTIAIVAKYTTFKADYNDMLITAGEFNRNGFIDLLAMFNSRQINFTVFNASVYTNFAFTDNTPFFIIVTGSVSGGNSVINSYVNGNAAVAGPSQTVTNYLLASLNLGGWDQVNSRTMTGGISEFVIYHSVLSNTDRQKLEGYLAHKWWGSGSVLPSGHPFKNSSPTV